jgi:uncharacterized membrane protein YoaK (UPF0700 family)
MHFQPFRLIGVSLSMARTHRSLDGVLARLAPKSGQPGVDTAMAPPNQVSESGPLPRAQVLCYSAVLALTAGFVNAVALLILAVPVGNVTGVTTQLGMDTAHPWLYESHALVAILLGFLIGAAISGAVVESNADPLGTRHAIVLIAEGMLLLLATAGLAERDIKTHIIALGIEESAVQAFLAAAALGLQNGLTSSFREMAVRTTHFTGTVTDLGLMLGRSFKQGIDKWKAVILTVTLLLFLTGGVVGIVFGVRFGGYALLVPAATCLSIAAANVLHKPAQPRVREDGSHPEHAAEKVSDRAPANCR